MNKVVVKIVLLGEDADEIQHLAANPKYQEMTDAERLAFVLGFQELHAPVIIIAPIIDESGDAWSTALDAEVLDIRIENRDEYEVDQEDEHGNTIFDV